jgi:tetratricopeptide (TPR) repeat protein
MTGGLLLAWGVSWAIAPWRFQSGLEWAKGRMAAGRFAEARAWLAGQTERDEADYLLGICEHALGHPEAALAAWSVVPPGSDFATRALLARAQTLVGDFGRFADAEPLLQTARRGTGPAAVEARYALFQLFFYQGRHDEMRRLLEEGWRWAPDPAADLRDHWRIDNAAVGLEPVRAAVEEATRRAPDDDRVWLAQANVAILTGHYDDARRRLDSCLRRRPDDPAVWRARLRGARAAADLAEVRRALPHVPADRLSPSEWLDLRAWIAARLGRPGEERKALEDLVERVPGATEALDRLAVLASEAGQSDRAAEFRHRKAEADAAGERYFRLLEDSGPITALAELSTLAEALGRPFEARGWCTLALRRAPGTPDLRAALARLNRHAIAPASLPGTTLADGLADLLPTPAVGQPAPPAASSPPEPGGARPDFRDDAEAVGLRFVHDNGRSELRQLPETSSGGVGLLDYDGDGWLDVYLVQGGPFPPVADSQPGDRLFRNRGDGTFEDATAASGLAGMARGYGHGVAVGDYDNDSHPDLFVTRWRSYALYRNRGDGTFEDACVASGLGGDRDWPTSAAFADLDNDGDLDLYVCHYLAWDAEHPIRCQRDRTKPYVDASRYTYCNPNPLAPRSDHLFRNDGGRFRDVTAEAGIVDRDGRGFGIVAADFDDDGRVDLYVANDTTANFLFRNRGGLRFEEVGLLAGAACGATGGYQAGMGTACGDLDGDGRLDLAVTNFYGESTTFYRNLGGGLFQDQTTAIGLAAPSRFLLGFGIAFLDVNNDGVLDLAIANGHVNDERPEYPYAMPALLLTGDAHGRLSDVSGVAGPPWLVPRLGRGLAAGDLDNDGRIDLVLLGQTEPVAYFHNRTDGGHWMTFRLQGTASNPDGVGARVTVTAAGRPRVAERTGGGSYQSASDPRLHFGLGSAGRVEAVEVRWPSGRVDRYPDLPADAGYLLREGDAEPKPLAGFAREVLRRGAMEGRMK